MIKTVMRTQVSCVELLSTERCRTAWKTFTMSLCDL